MSTSTNEGITENSFYLICVFGEGIFTDALLKDEKAREDFKKQILESD